MGKPRCLVAVALLATLAASTVFGDKFANFRIRQEPFLEKERSTAFVVSGEGVDPKLLKINVRSAFRTVILTKPDGERVVCFRPVDTDAALFDAGVAFPEEEDPRALRELLGVDALVVLTAGASRRHHRDLRIDAKLRFVVYAEEGLLMTGETDWIAHGMQDKTTAAVNAFERLLKKLPAHYAKFGSVTVDL